MSETIIVKNLPSLLHLHHLQIIYLQFLIPHIDKGQI